MSRFDDLMVQEIEPCLGREKPTFLYDYPAERGALARLKKDDPTLAERFELYVGGLELANAFSELTDPQEQRKRFLSEEAHRRAMQKTTLSHACQISYGTGGYAAFGGNRFGS